MIRLAQQIRSIAQRHDADLKHIDRVVAVARLQKVAARLRALSALQAAGSRQGAECGNRH